MSASSTTVDSANHGLKIFGEKKREENSLFLDRTCHIVITLFIIVSDNYLDRINIVLGILSNGDDLRFMKRCKWVICECDAVLP